MESDIPVLSGCVNCRWLIDSATVEQELLRESQLHATPKGQSQNQVGAGRVGSGGSEADGRGRQNQRVDW